MSSNLLTSSRSCIPPLSVSLAVGSAALTLARPCGCSSAVSVNSRLNFSCSTTFVSWGARSAAADNAGAHQFALFGLSYGSFIQKPLFYCLSYLFYTKKKIFSLACGSSAAMLTNVASSEIHKNK